MSRHMSVQRTTVRLEESLLKRAKREAVRRGSTVTALMEEGLQLVLAEKYGKPAARVKLPLCRAGGGVLPGVDLNDSTSLLDIMEARR